MTTTSGRAKQGLPMRSSVLRRLRYLRDWELANVLLVPAMILLIAYVGADPLEYWTRRAAGVATVSYLLLQGGLYWHLKLRNVANAASTFPGWFRQTFVTLRRTNPVVLVVAWVAILRSDAPSGTGLSSDFAWGSALIALAALEHVNYYIWQLMHDTPADVAFLRHHRRLRRPALWRDLRLSQDSERGSSKR